LDRPVQLILLNLSLFRPWRR